MFTFQVERTWDLVRDSGQRKLTSSFQNHCTLHSVPVGAKPLSPRQCAPSRSIYLSRRLNSHWEILVTTHHLQKWESQLRLRWIFVSRVAPAWIHPRNLANWFDAVYFFLLWFLFFVFFLSNSYTLQTKPDCLAQNGFSFATHCAEAEHNSSRKKQYCLW